jgi:hypothetical protein
MDGEISKKGLLKIQDFHFFKNLYRKKKNIIIQIEFKKKEKRQENINNNNLKIIVGEKEYKKNFKENERGREINFTKCELFNRLLPYEKYLLRHRPR